MENTTLNLSKKLLEVQQELKAPKDQHNNFGNYDYRSCESILSSVKPILRKHGLALTMSDELVLIGDRYYVKATATLIDTDNAGDTVTVTANAREEETKKGMDQSQVTGSCSSYARKYALCGLFAIDDGNDSDKVYQGDNNPPKQQKTKQNTKPQGQAPQQQQPPQQQPQGQAPLPVLTEYQRQATMLFLSQNAVAQSYYLNLYHVQDTSQLNLAAVYANLKENGKINF
ncbi:MAG: ERF family protein [Bacteroidales bacterium]|nr:ERF family protein [Bacteroidales bacterium]